MAFMILLEFTRICRVAIKRRLIIAAFSLLSMICIAWLADLHPVAYLIFFASVFVLAIMEYSLSKTLWTATGLAYAALPFFALSELRGDTLVGLLMMIILFSCVWGADVSAYFAGRTIGGPKLAPSISPKKTWAGFVGALIGAVCLTFLVISWTDFNATQELVMAVLVLAVISQLGDLLESSMKRKFDVKDSGTIIPGHGGVLDRVDGFITASVALWIALIILREDTIYGSDGSLAVVFARLFLGA